MAAKKPRRKYRRYSPEFRQEAVALFRSSGRSQLAVAEELDVPRSLLSQWIAKAEKEEEDVAGISDPERKELIRLRRENKQLQLERDFLKKATAFFANQKK